MKFINACFGSGPPDRACVVHHGTDELPVEQYSISNGQASPPDEEGAMQIQYLSRLLPYLRVLS
jgi:hypothetical protein